MYNGDGGSTFLIICVVVRRPTRIVIDQVKATGGDTHLGGEDFDNKLVDWAVSEFEKQHGAGRTNKLKANNRAIRRLRTACENAKRAVSSAPTTTLEVQATLLSNKFCIVLRAFVTF